MVWEWWFNWWIASSLIMLIAKFCQRLNWIVEDDGILRKEYLPTPTGEFAWKVLLLINLPGVLTLKGIKQTSRTLDLLLLAFIRTFWGKETATEWEHIWDGGEVPIWPPSKLERKKVRK